LLSNKGTRSTCLIVYCLSELYIAENHLTRIKRINSVIVWNWRAFHRWIFNTGW